MEYKHPDVADPDFKDPANTMGPKKYFYSTLTFSSLLTISFLLSFLDPPWGHTNTPETLHRLRPGVCPYWRREWDLNPRGPKAHRISTPGPQV